MNGGKTINKYFPHKDKRQHLKTIRNYTLNYLRFKYFLGPEKLKAEGVDMEKFGAYQRLEDYLKKVLGNTFYSMDSELYLTIQGIAWNLSQLLPAIKEKLDLSHDDKKTLTYKMEKNSFNAFILGFNGGTLPHFNFPELEVGNSKRFKDLIKKIIIFQSFTLGKTLDEIKIENPDIAINQENKPRVYGRSSYLDYLEEGLSRNSENKDLIEGIRIVKKRLRDGEKYLKKTIRNRKSVTKDLALFIYGQVNNQSMAHVRKDRERLKKYKFL